MRLGVIADDFTGASDIANTLTKGGLSTALAFNACPEALPDGFDCCVVALKSRSIAAEEAVAQSIAAADGLARLGARQFIFKYCSTFDSTPKGNIGPVTEALANRLGVEGAVALCPAFPDAGRTVYQGHLFVHAKLLSESGMENHPLNPMTDPDIRRWLALQSKGAVGHLALAVVRAGHDAIRERLAAEAGEGRLLVIADAIENRDLMLLGEAVAGDVLVTGGSGVAMGIAPIHAAAVSRRREPAAVAVDGPALILAGSCSNATRAQVDRYREDHPALKVEADDIVSGRTTPGAALDFISGNLGRAPLVYSSDEPEAVRAAQERHGAAKLADALECFFGDVAREMVGAGVRRLVVAGGETSGAVVNALGAPLFLVGPEIAIGVPALKALDSSLAVVLKSGNFGAPDFFASAVRALGSGH